MRRLNLGCGGNILDGWENHDSDVDLEKPLPFEDNSIDFILLEHCWEHFESKIAFQILKECQRILKVRGVLRLCVPILERLERGDAIDIICNHGHKCAYTRELVDRMLWVAMFHDIYNTERKPCDGHFRVIGTEKDNRETYRVEAIK